MPLSLIFHNAKLCCSALYIRDSPYERSDAVFGVKESLLVRLKSVSDIQGYAEKYGVSPSTRLMQYDFVLVTEDESNRIRNEKALEAIQKQGVTGMKVIDGLPVPDVD